jgi:putative ABC transport system permease protein
VDASWNIVEVPPDGLALSKVLADTLGLSPGDRAVVEVLEGKQPTLEIAVSAVVDDYMGMNVYMNVNSLHRIMQESDTLSGAWLQADPAEADRLYRQLKNTPAVAGVSLKNAAMQSFDETFAELMGTMRAIYTLFAGIIAFGVVYNSARISLSERARELATLRVIGFTKGEASYILLGEMAIVTLAALPVGVALGHGMVIALVENLTTEVYRFPATVTDRTSMFAALSVFGAAVLSGLIVRRKLDHLDLVEALKIRE